MIGCKKIFPVLLLIGLFIFPVHAEEEAEIITDDVYILSEEVLEFDDDVYILSEEGEVLEESVSLKESDILDDFDEIIVSTQDKEIEEQEPEFKLTEDEAKLIAQVTWNESGNQSELGKRLVIDTVLNRVEHSKFPDSVSSVIHQPNQYSDYSSKVHDDILELVYDEASERTNTEVIFFQCKSHSSYGEPLLVEGAHYFNSLKEACDE